MTFYGCLLLLMVLQMFNTLEQTIEIEGLLTREREREYEYVSKGIRILFNRYLKGSFWALTSLMTTGLVKTLIRLK